MITMLKSAVICFQLQNCVFFCLLFYLRKNVRKLLRNSEYSKLQKAKKLWVLRPDLSFLEKSVYGRLTSFGLLS